MSIHNKQIKTQGYTKSSLKTKSKVNPLPYKLNEVIPYVANSLEEIILQNEIDDQDSKCLMKDVSPFFCDSLPEISISDFLMRVSKYSKIEASTLIIMSIYIDKFCEECSYYISYYNIYR